MVIWTVSNPYFQHHSSTKNKAIALKKGEHYYVCK